MADFEIFDFNNTQTELIFSQVFGWSSGILCFSVLIPQIIHTWRVKSAHDLSYWFLALNLLCSSLFVGYALVIGSLPMLVCDIIVVCLGIGLICSKYILDKRNKEEHVIKDVKVEIDEEDEEKKIE
jgi:uncharacterized protein with PQ loop repeat